MSLSILVSSGYIPRIGIAGSYKPQDWKRSVFIPIPKKGNAKECSNYGTIALISHASKAIVKREQRAENHTLRNP